MVLIKKSGPIQDLGEKCHFEFSPDLALSFLSGLGHVLIYYSGPTQDPDSGPTQDSGPILPRSGLRFYYTEGIVTKCQERFTYRFGDQHLTALLDKDTKFNDDSKLALMESYSPEIEEVSEFKAIAST